MASRVAIWPLEKQRRSRINWRDLLPKHIAIQQEAYERRATVAALVEKKGMPFRHVAKLFGISPTLAGGFYRLHERYRSRHGDLSPAEIWLSANASDWLCV